ncbi:extracellular solute-binding protein [Paenibacillus sp. GP183]|uniref:ABC transporter substrate-binding protein n=1 Tax=Paenibacillus sp. GP183 TaxID=1882751 RepID=UPI00089549A3|nr:extracellular solute-binding protein [Paenibacillus sp. GP183]SEB85961.1 iron(III) transport system substrate-binding protein [Paenibacillus sp. GP183]
MLKKLKYIATVSSVLSIAALLATGCGSVSTPNQNASANSTSSPAANSSAPTASSSSAPTASPAAVSKELVVYSATGFDKPVADAFQKKTGITVKLVQDSTGPLLARLQAENSNPQWDIIWADGAPSMQGLDNQNMLLKDYVPATSSNYTDLGKKLVPSDNSYHPVTVTAAGAIAYNTQLVKDSEVPKDWSDLLTPTYKGAFAMNNPSISGPTYTTVFGLMMLQGGISQGEDFFAKFKANGLTVFDSNGPTLTNLLKGTVKFAIAQDSAIIAKMKDKANPIKIAYPASGVSTLSNNIAIDAKAPHLDAAKQFVDYVLTVEAQKLAQAADTGDAAFESIIQGAPAAAGLRPDGIKWNTVDPIAGAQHENEVKTWFTQNIVQK